MIHFLSKCSLFQQTFIQPSIFKKKQNIFQTSIFRGHLKFHGGGEQQKKTTHVPFNEKWTHIFGCCNTTFRTSLASGSVKSTLGASSSDSTVKGGVGAPTASPQGQGTVAKGHNPQRALGGLINQWEWRSPLFQVLQYERNV